VTGANPDPETARRKLGYNLGLLRHDQRVAWVGGDDGCAQLDAGGGSSGSRKTGQTIQAGPAGGHPRGMNAQFLGTQNVRLNFCNGAAPYGCAN